MDNPVLRYEPFEEGQEFAVSQMVWEVFSEFEAPDYSSEGVNTFREFIEPQSLADRIKNGGFKVYCCYEGDILAGVLALRSITHISLLFVKKSYQQRGIARELLRIATEDILNVNFDTQKLTVNSSPYAVRIYQKLGFFADDAIQERYGIKYIPMTKWLNK